MEERTVRKNIISQVLNNVKVLKIKKGDIEYEFDRKVSKNSNGGYLMGMQIKPTKNEEMKKSKNEEKTQKLKMKKRGILAWKRVRRLK